MNPHEITIFRDVIDNETVEGILKIFDKHEVRDVTITEDGISPTQIGADDTIIKFEEMDREILLCKGTEEENTTFLKVVDWVNENVRTTGDFEKVEEWRIISYPQGSFQNFAMEEDEKFTGIVLIELCNDYKGGALIVDNNTITMSEGDIVQFNNPSTRHYGLTPVIDGERIVLELWYSPFEDESEETETEPNGNIYQKVSLKT